MQVYRSKSSLKFQHYFLAFFLLKNFRKNIPFDFWKKYQGKKANYKSVHSDYL